MGSVKKHRRVESDSDSLQKKERIDGHSTYKFDTNPFSKIRLRWGKNSTMRIKSALDYWAEDGFYVIDDTMNFIENFKA